MTEIEFFATEKWIEKELKELKELQKKKNEQLDHYREEWCRELCNRYKKYIGEKVRITFKLKKNGQIVKKEGFLMGFSFQEGLDLKGIMPDVAKIKSDGKASKNLIPKYEMHYYDEIVLITQI